ncbi:MAG: mhpC [Bacteroidota bacterium]|jgi:pimeloyl-ACP methyl ester carboxylesterase|nr:mhpC [Bacteroidota bacterium]
MRKLISIFLSLTIFCFSSCLKLDENLFNQEKLTEYKLENYSGETDFKLDYTYSIPENKISLFTLNSQASGESSATKIYAVYIGDINRISSDTIIMYCHGNKDHMDFYWQRAKLLANTGSKNRFGVMMIDYRGYGMSEGKPTEEGLYADVDAALIWLKSKGLSNDRLIIYGFSLGSAPATKLTAEPRSLTPSKLMLEAPFANAETMIQDGSGLAMPSGFFTSLKINNAEKIKSVQQPFFWIHGEDDDFLNIATHGQRVYDNYHGTYGEAHKIQGAGHSTIPSTQGFNNYLNSVHSFITH